MNTLKIGHTSKGRRVWLQGTERYGWHGGDRYDIKYNPSTIVITRSPEGARGVTDAKGGVIDLCNGKVTQWAQEASECVVKYTEDTITIRRAQA